MPRLPPGFTATEFNAKKFTVTFDPELLNMLRAYHQATRPGFPITQTIRELLYQGLHVPIDITRHRMQQVEAHHAARVFVFQRTHDFLNRLAQEMKQQLDAAVAAGETDEERDRRQRAIANGDF